MAAGTSARLSVGVVWTQGASFPTAWCLPEFSGPLALGCFLLSITQSVSSDCQRGEGKAEREAFSFSPLPSLLAAMVGQDYPRRGRLGQNLPMCWPYEWLPKYT